MNIQRLVVKVGTSTLTHASGTLDLRSMERLVRVLSDLSGSGLEVVLVTSGAIAVGSARMGLAARPDSLPMKQAAAAVGQCELMHLYDKFFGDYGKTVAQILLTGDDMEQPKVRQNLLNTFNSLLGLGIIPIVNENDSVSYAEIESAEHKIFGDNDTLSAAVAVLCEADILVLLSDIDGLYEGNPAEDPTARLIREVRVIDDEITSLASGAGSRRGTGGMITKLQAARMAMEKRIDMVIANGAKPERLYDIAEGRPAGTLFVGRRKKHD